MPSLPDLRFPTPGLGLFGVVDESDGSLLPRRDVGHVGTKHGVEAEADRFAMEHTLVVGNREFSAIGRGAGDLHCVFTVKR